MDVSVAGGSPVGRDGSRPPDDLVEGGSLSRDGSLAPDGLVERGGSGDGLVMVGLSHRTAPIELRERFALSGGRLAAWLRAFAEHPGVRECVVLSTCNRTECYAAGDDAEHLDRLARAALCGSASVEGKDAGCLRTLRGADVARHLFRVTSGLESLIVGEPQIQGQVRDAYRDGQPRSMGPVLHRLFQSALGVGGRVRADTSIGSGAASVPGAALSLARTVFGTLEGRSVLVLGTGEMGRLTVRCLRSKGAGRVFLASRDEARAERVGRPLGAVPLPRDVALKVLTGRPAADVGTVDLVVTCTEAEAAFLRAEHLVDLGAPAGRKAQAGSGGGADSDTAAGAGADAGQGADAGAEADHRAGGPVGVRRGRGRGAGRAPLLILDIAVPRNVDPEVAGLEGVSLYNIDDMRRVVKRTREAREVERGRAESIIERGVERFQAWHLSRRADPAVRTLRETTRRLVAKAWDECSGGTGDREADETLRLASRAALNRVLHEPTRALRWLAAQPDGEARLQALEARIAAAAATAGRRVEPRSDGRTESGAGSDADGAAGSGAGEAAGSGAGLGAGLPAGSVSAGVRLVREAPPDENAGAVAERVGR